MINSGCKNNKSGKKGTLLMQFQVVEMEVIKEASHFLALLRQWLNSGYQ